jgi:hypothetical protein
MDAELLVAAIVLAVCVAMLARMAIGQRRRDRLDAGIERTARSVNQRTRTLWHRRRLHDQAER